MIQIIELIKEKFDDKSGETISTVMGTIIAIVLICSVWFFAFTGHADDFERSGLIYTGLVASIIFGLLKFFIKRGGLSYVITILLMGFIVTILAVNSNAERTFFLNDGVFFMLFLFNSFGVVVLTALPIIITYAIIDKLQGGSVVKPLDNSVINDIVNATSNLIDMAMDPRFNKGIIYVYVIPINESRELYANDSNKFEARALLSKDSSYMLNSMMDSSYINNYIYKPEHIFNSMHIVGHNILTYKESYSIYIKAIHDKLFDKYGKMASFDCDGNRIIIKNILPSR